MTRRQVFPELAVLIVDPFLQTTSARDRFREANPIMWSLHGRDLVSPGPFTSSRSAGVGNHTSTGLFVEAVTFPSAA
jgi:hypothetical protein